MRFSDKTQFQIPQPTKYANSDSSPFNSDESLSEEDFQTFVTPPSFSTSNQNTPSITSNDKSLTPSTNYNSLYRHIINTVTAPPELRVLQQTQPSLRRINWEKNKRRGNRQLTNNQKQKS